MLEIWDQVPSKPDQPGAVGLRGAPSPFCRSRVGVARWVSVPQRHLGSLGPSAGRFCPARALQGQQEPGLRDWGWLLLPRALWASSLQLVQAQDSISELSLSLKL